MRVLRSMVFSLAVLCALAQPGLAQDTAAPQEPPHVAFVDGAASLDREDGTEPAAPGAPLIDGDRLTTTRGRVEIVFPDGSILDVDEDSRVEYVAPAFLRVTSGRVLLLVAGTSDPATAPRFQVDTPAATVHTRGPGEYRISLAGGPSGVQTELAVLRGAASLSGDRTSVPLRPGERSTVFAHADPTYPHGFNSARLDAFAHWAAARRDERLASRSSPYLPSELRGYGGMLDRAGAWSYDPPYGYVWYPNVAADWRPYSDGYWSSFPEYGWMWIGVSAWSWPTHHYGRWGYTGARWYWIPGRTFAPAWVSWGAAPGYVSWCPLGFDNRPVFALSVGSGRGWVGWTVLSRDHFGARGYRVRDYALRADRLPRNAPFMGQAPPPAPRARQAAARRYPGSAAGWNRADRAFKGRDTGSHPREGESPRSERRWEIRPPTAVPRDPALPRDRSNDEWTPRRSVDPFMTRPSRRPTPDAGEGPRAVPPRTAQPGTPQAPERPRYGTAYRRSPGAVSPDYQAAPETAPPLGLRSRRPPVAGSGDARGADSYPPLRPRGREDRAAPPAQPAPPSPQEQRPGAWGDGGRARARPRDGDGANRGDGGGRTGAGQAPDRPSGGDGRGPRRPR